VLEQILPGGVAVASTRGDILDAALLPAEEAVVARAVEKRRREFASGRACARRALAQVGVDSVAIPSGPRGEPQWPQGIVGSITHCEGYRGCAVARRSDFATIGVDAEVDAGLPPGVLGDIALAEERRQLTELASASGGPSWDRLLFSIKESVYKAWFPLAGCWLGFEDASVIIDAKRRTFAARLLVPGPSLGGGELNGFSGEWWAGQGLLVSAIAVPAPEVESGPASC